MTLPASVPLPPPGPVPAPPPPPPEPVEIPARWLLDHASPPVQARVIRELLALDPAQLPASLGILPYASRNGLELFRRLQVDGTMPGGLLGVGGGWDRIGLVPAWRRLMELGWDPELPALAPSKRLLFRLLAEDADPHWLFELEAEATDEALVRRGRLLLREAAAAALAHAGYDQDPRLRGAAGRLLARVATFLRSPLVHKPFVREGNQHVIPEEATPPSYHLLVMLAHLPHLRSEQHDLMERLYVVVSQPAPRSAAVQRVGRHLVEQPQLVLGDPLSTRGVMDGDMPSALAWLDLMGRLGFLRRHDGWLRLLDRLLDDRDRQGIWRPPRSVVMPERVPTWAWPTLPLSDDPPSPGAASGVALAADVTFRLALVARAAGRPLVWV